MTTNQQMMVFLLRALRRMDGLPMPHDTLISTMTVAFPAATRTEVEVVAKDLEAEGYISAVTDLITGKVWSLTTKGQSRAWQLA